MTAAESKVNEFANKILDYIEKSEEQKADPKWILQGVKGYICGMSDGIEFAEEMRAPDHDVQAKTDEPRPMVGDSVNLNLCKEPLGDLAKTFEDSHLGWPPEDRSELEDILDKKLGVPEPRSGVEIRCNVKA
jgi:hypothetical protein